MKHVIWTDTKTGKRHRSLLRDSDPDSAAAQGIPADPPDITALDTEELLTRLHNELVDRGLYTWADVQRTEANLTGAILTVFRRELIQLYRMEMNHDQPG